MHIWNVLTSFCFGVKINSFFIFYFTFSPSYKTIQYVDRFAWIIVADSLQVQVSAGTQITDWPGRYINVRRCGGLSVVLLHMKDTRTSLTSAPHIARATRYYQGRVFFGLVLPRVRLGVVQDHQRWSTWWENGIWTVSTFTCDGNLNGIRWINVDQRLWFWTRPTSNPRQNQTKEKPPLV